MNEPEKKLKNCCLGDELLNLAIDGEYAFSDSEREHLETCEACRQRYGELRKLDRLLCEHWEIPGEKFSAAAVRFSVQRKLAEQRRTSASRAFRPMAAAAGIMLVAGAVLLFNGKLLPPNPIPSAVETAEAPIALSAAPTAGVKVFPYYATRPSAVDRVGFGPSVRVGNEEAMPLGSLVPVDSSRSNVMFNYLTNLVASSRQTPAAVDSDVSHIWVADKASNPEAVLPQLLGQCGIDAAALSVTPLEAGGFEATANMTKAQLLRFVRAASGVGWELISPQQPQPESVIAAPEQDKPVRYSFKLIPAK